MSDFQLECLAVMYRCFLKLTVLCISTGPGGAGSSGAVQVPPQGLLQEGRHLHQGAGSTLQLQCAGHQPEHNNVLRLRRERLLHRGNMLSKNFPATDACYTDHYRSVIGSFPTAKSVVVSCM